MPSSRTEPPLLHSEDEDNTATSSGDNDDDYMDADASPAPSTGCKGAFEKLPNWGKFMAIFVVVGGFIGALVGLLLGNGPGSANPMPRYQQRPVVISTWFQNAVQEAWTYANHSFPALDIVENGCITCEDARCDGTVGWGGSPDIFGETTLDALIMDGTLMDVGAVGYLRRVKHAASAARKVMHYTGHTLLAGDGATNFSVNFGFPQEDLHSPESIVTYVNWTQAGCQPNFFINVENQNTSCPPYIPIPTLAPTPLAAPVEENAAPAAAKRIDTQQQSTRTSTTRASSSSSSSSSKKVVSVAPPPPPPSLSLPSNNQPEQRQWVHYDLDAAVASSTWWSRMTTDLLSSFVTSTSAPTNKYAHEAAWRASQNYQQQLERRRTRPTPANQFDHDTIGMCGMDVNGNIAVGVSSNGANHKVAGRIGDAPIVGAGGYASSEAGCSAATGDGDITMRFLPAYTAVENMRRGMSPEDACTDAVKRIEKFYPVFELGLLCLDAYGQYGAASHGWDFTYCVASPSTGGVAICVKVPGMK